MSERDELIGEFESPSVEIVRDLVGRPVREWRAWLQEDPLRPHRVLWALEEIQERFTTLAEPGGQCPAS